MIRLTSQPTRGELAVVPMINVAFLLLIFFLMTAVIEPVEEHAVTLPQSTSGGDAEGVTLWMDSSGTIFRDGSSGPAALEGLRGQVVRLRVDASLPAGDLAQLLSRLAQAGAISADIVTISR